MQTTRLWPRLVALGLVVASPMFAQSNTRRVTILFVGNSFFHGQFEPVKSYNAAGVDDENATIAAGNPRSEDGDGPYGGIPGIFKTLTEQAGLNYDVHAELMSGKPLSFHYANALSVIDQPRWDVVIMHDLSTGPIPAIRSGKPDAFVKYADLLEKSIHSANKSAEVYLYETWPRADLTYAGDKAYHGESIDVMGTDLHDAYYREIAHNPRIRAVAPAGDAWLHAIHSGVAEPDPFHPEAGKIDLWGPDNYHPSIYGAYLNALVVFEQVTGKDARALGAGEKAAADLGIAPEMATTLQRIAHEQVLAGG